MAQTQSSKRKKKKKRDQRTERNEHEAELERLDSLPRNTSLPVVEDDGDEPFSSLLIDSGEFDGGCACGNYGDREEGGSEVTEAREEKEREGEEKNLVQNCELHSIIDIHPLTNRSTEEQTQNMQNCFVSYHSTICRIMQEVKAWFPEAKTVKVCGFEFFRNPI